MRVQGSIQQRLRRLSLLTSGVALLAASASFVVYDVRTFRTSSIQRLSSQAEIVGTNSVSALLFNDDEAAHETLQALASEPVIQTAAIYGRDGRLFARYVRPGRAVRPLPETDELAPAPRAGSLWAPLVIRHAIYFQDGMVGAVRLDCDLWPQMRDRLVQYLVIVLLVSLGALAVAGLVTGRLQRLLTHPINDLVNTARIVSQSRDYSVRVRSTADGELRVLVQTFNQMLADIEQRDAALSDSRAQLEQKVLERTLELQRELYDRQRAEEARAHSQALLARAEALAQIGSWEWDLRHEEMRWSDQLYRLLGARPETRASYEGLRDGVHPDDRAAFARQLERTRATGESVTFEHRIVRPDGIRIVQAQVERLSDATGHGLRMVGTAQDVTERRQAETEREQLIRAQVAQQVAEASERRAAALAEASAELVASLDVESALPRVVRGVIPEFADWCSVHLVEDGSVRRVALACADSETERAGWQIPYTPASRALIARVMEEPPTLVTDLRDEHLTQWFDGEGLEAVRHIGARSVMLLALRARGQALGIVSFAMTASGRRFGRVDLAFAENIGSRIATALDNARLYREAQNANRMKDEFLATLSHELRTPLNAIVGWTQLLRVGALDKAEAQRAIETIDRNARAQAQLIEDILDVSRIISGKLQLEMGPVDLGPVVLAAVDAIRPGAEAKQIVIEKDLTSGTVVTGDPDRLQQIFWNLFSNATKFTPRGGRLEVRLARANGQAEVSVVDTGAGIEPEFLPHVFERFRQADASSTRAHRGLGLGLAIVRHLTELHGGTVQATSAGRDQGSTFTVVLPLAGLDLPAAPSHGTRAAADSVALDGIKVIVVDDEPDGREVIEATLGRLGARVLTASSSREAMDLIPREHPDVLVADIEMPIMDGYALLRWLRSLPAAEGGGTPALALTGYARAEDRRNALAAGFQAHLTKPVRPEDVARTVRRLALARSATG